MMTTTTTTEAKQKFSIMKEASRTKVCINTKDLVWTSDEECDTNNDVEETAIDSNTVAIAEKAGSQDEDWLEDEKEVGETFKKSADLKQSRTSPINTSDLHFPATINWDPQCAEQQKAYNEKISKINTLLESLASADHLVQSKFMTIKSLLLQAVDETVMKQILYQSDRLIKGLDVIFKAYNSKASKLRVMNSGLVGGSRLTGSEERQLLMKMLEFVNSIGILIPNSLQGSYERSSHKQSLFKQLLMTSNPEVNEISCKQSSNIQTTFKDIVNKIGEDEGEEGYLILAELTSSHESANRTQSDFITCLKLASQAVKKSPILKNLSSSSKYLARLTIRTKSGKEIELADEFVKAITMDKEDNEVNLIEFDHHDRQHHDQPQDSIQQVRIIQILNFCHMLVYLGEDYKTELRNIEQKIHDAWFKTKEEDKISQLRQSQSMVAGSTIMSHTHMITWKDKEFRPLHDISSCRGIVLFIQKCGPCSIVRAYFPDIGATGNVPLDCVRPAPVSLEIIPPAVYFCKLQGLLPYPELDLVEASVQTLSYLCVQNEEELVKALPLLPSLLAINKDSITVPVTRIMGSISVNLSLVRNLANHAEGQQQLIGLVNYVVVFLDKHYSTLDPQVMTKLLNYITTFLDLFA